jgi:hypothetical protein
MKEQRGSGCHQEEQPQQSENDPFHQDQPPGQGFTTSASVRTHSSPSRVACLRRAPIMGTHPHDGQRTTAQWLGTSPKWTIFATIHPTSWKPNSRKFDYPACSELRLYGVLGSWGLR